MASSYRFNMSGRSETSSKRRVSWAPDLKLRQVRLFLSEDSPSQVGLGAQDHLQAKASWLLHSSGAGSDDQLPPGFEGALSPSQPKIELCQVPLIKWRSPPRFVLNPNWQVVAGEESKEVEFQKHREMRVLEAIYPRPSSIPPSPSIPPEIQDSQCDDRHTPVIPITPIEDEDVTDPSSHLMASANIPTSSQLPALPQSLLPPGISQTAQQSSLHHIPSPPTNQNPALGNIPGVAPDIVAAASAAFTAIMRSNEQGSLIDPELLIKILSNPKMIENLVGDHAIPGNSKPAPIPRSPPINLPVPHSSPSPVHMNRIERETPMAVAPTTSHFNPIANAMASTLQPPPPPAFLPASSQPVKAPLVKDTNYYKSLIQQHGGERSDAQDQTPQFPQFGNPQHCHPSGLKTYMSHSSKQKDAKPKIKKHCIYYNSSRGCKHGANCAYQHDTTVQQRVGSMPEAQSAKRMKLDREITGRS